MTTYQNAAGVDVQLDVTPDNPTAWGRFSPDTLTAIDHLATTIARNTTDWAIALHIGNHTVLTAGPATTNEQDAAA